jgi:hypothetical protein
LLSLDEEGMNKSVRILLVLFAIGFSHLSFAQRWFKTSELEFGIIVGASHYSGDLTQSYFETRGMKPSFGLITRYTPAERVTFRLSGQFGGMAGDDTWYEKEDDENPRRLNFKSVLWDFTAAAEINLRALEPMKSSGTVPYVFIGASVFKYNPLAQFIYDPSSPHLTRLNSDYASLANRDQEWVALQTLGTEGQETTEFNERKRYNLTQIAIPIGAGFKFKMNHKWSLGIEYGVRITFTDYLDDVSTTYVDPTRIEGQYGAMAAAMADRSPILHEENFERGNSQKNDSYGILGLTLTYRIYGNRDKCVTF